MKVIDLLNKIANKQKVPKKIKCNDDIYWYDETDLNEVNRYIDIDNGILTDYCNLNDEVEIIEEPQPKKIEKWQDLAITLMKRQEDSIDDDIKKIKNYIETIMRTQNEIIDYLEENK